MTQDANQSVPAITGNPIGVTTPPTGEPVSGAQTQGSPPLFSQSLPQQPQQPQYQQQAPLYNPYQQIQQPMQPGQQVQQPQQQVQQQPVGQTANFQGLTTDQLTQQYEARIRGIMSSKDTLINQLTQERNQAIADYANLQGQYEAERLNIGNQANTAVQAAQSAITRATTAEASLAQYKAQALRAQALLAKPHLAPYQNLLPLTDDEAVLTQSITQLETIRQQDMAAAGVPSARLNSMMNGATTGTIPQNPYMQGFNSATSQPLPQQQGYSQQMPPPQVPNPYAINSGQPGMAPNTALNGVPGSNPMPMGTQGGQGVAQTVKAMLDKALRESPAAYEAALAQAAAMAVNDARGTNGGFNGY